MSSKTPVQPRFQCRHVFTSGHRCGSPALRQENFCFYHHNARKPAAERHQAAEQSSRRRAAFALPAPEDRSAIQSAIGQVLLRLAANELDARRAGLLLYGLQIASLNLPPQKLPIDPADTVEEVVEDPQLGPLAPPADFDKRLKREKNLEEILTEQWEEQKEQWAKEAPQQGPIPTLQAVAQPSPNRPPRISFLTRSSSVSLRAGCPILSGSIGKGGKYTFRLAPSRPHPPIAASPRRVMPHDRLKFTAPIVGIERSSTAFPHPTHIARVPYPFRLHRKGWEVHSFHPHRKPRRGAAVPAGQAPAPFTPKSRLNPDLRPDPPKRIL